MCIHWQGQLLRFRDANTAEFANSVDLDEVAHNEPPHLELHCLPSCLRILNMIQLGLDIFLKICRRLLFGSKRVGD